MALGEGREGNPFYYSVRRDVTRLGWSVFKEFDNSSIAEYLDTFPEKEEADSYVKGLKARK